MYRLWSGFLWRGLRITYNMHQRGGEISRKTVQTKGKTEQGRTQATTMVEGE